MKKKPHPKQEQKPTLENKKSKCSNGPHSPILTWLLLSHLPYIIYHLEHLSCFMELDCTSSSFSQNPVTLSEHQGHPNWNQTAEFSCVQHHTKFKANSFTSVPTQDGVKLIFYKIMSAEFSSFHEPTNQQVVATYWISSKLTVKLPRKFRQEFLISHTTVTLNEGQGNQNWYQNVELSSLYHYTKFERNLSIDVWIQANVKVLTK